MTPGRGRGGWLPAVLVALAVGAGTAGIGSVLATEPPTVVSAPHRVTAVLPPSPEPLLPPAPPRTRKPVRPTTAPARVTRTSAPAPPTVTSNPATTPLSSTPPSVSPSKPPTTVPTDQPVAAQVLALTNAERAAAGCAPLTPDARLDRAARTHSADMAARDYFSHVSLDGRTFVDRVVAAGYANPGAENIAFGQRTAAQVMDAWMASAGHRAHILDCELKTMGLGLDTDGYYWTQLFGR